MCKISAAPTHDHSTECCNHVAESPHCAKKSFRFARFRTKTAISAIGITHAKPYQPAHIRGGVHPMIRKCLLSASLGALLDPGSFHPGAYGFAAIPVRPAGRSSQASEWKSHRHWQRQEVILAGRERWQQQTHHAVCFGPENSSARQSWRWNRCHRPVPIN